MSARAVILAAGESTRMRPLSYTLPKPLFKIAGKAILEHNLEQLFKAGVNKITIVLGYLGEKIKAFVESSWIKEKCEIEFVTQAKQLGTAHALLKAKPTVKEKSILILNGSDLYFTSEIEKVLSVANSLAVSRVANVSNFGEVRIDENGNVVEIVEKPNVTRAGIVSTGLYHLDSSLLEILEERELSQMPDFINHLAKQNEIKAVEIVNWLPLKYPWDLLQANELLLKNVKRSVSEESEIEEGSVIKGSVVIGKGSVIRSGSYIQGPVFIGENCELGPNCRIRPFTFIDSNCKIGSFVEVKNSIIWSGTKIPHLTYVGDSIIGRNCNLGAGSIIANLRHDNASVRVLIKGKLIDSGRRKLGVVMADGCKLGINTSVYPGIIMGPYSWTAPGEIVNDNLEPFTLLKNGTKIRLKLENFKKVENIEEIGKLYEKLKDVSYKSRGELKTR